MQNDEGRVVDLYIPRKCTASNRLIGAKVVLIVWEKARCHSRNLLRTVTELSQAFMS